MISESVFTVQGHGVHTAFLETTQALKSNKAVSVVVNKLRKPADITHIQTVGFYALFHLLFGPGKKVVSAHVVPDSFVGSFIGAERWYPIARWYLRFFYNKADLLLAVSHMVNDVLLNDLKVKPPITVVYNSIDTSHYKSTRAQRAAVRKKLKIKPEDFVVMGSGQIQPRKRFGTFIETAKKMPQFKFIWVGGIPFKQLGADYKELSKLIECAPENVTITGVVDHKKMARYYQAADVFFFPSVQETFGLSVVEAAASGLPILVRNISDYDDTFGDLVRKADEDEFVAILKKLQADKQFYQDAKKDALKLAQRYDSKKVCQRLCNYYEELLRKD